MTAIPTYEPDPRRDAGLRARCRLLIRAYGPAARLVLNRPTARAAGLEPLADKPVWQGEWHGSRLVTVEMSAADALAVLEPIA